MKKYTFIIVLFLFSNLGIAQSNDSTLVSISVSDVSFADFIIALEKESDLKIIYSDDWFKDLSVSTSVKSQELTSIIEKVIAKDGYEVIYWNGFVVILPEVDLINELPDYNGNYQIISDEKKDAPTESTSFIKGRRVDLLKIKIGSSKYQKPGIRVSISGTIVDVATNEPIEAATIYIAEINKGAISDENGKFELDLIAGQYAAKVGYLGMKNLNCQLDVMSEGSFTISLERAHIEMDEVQIFGDDQMNFREKEAGLEKLNVEAIRELPTMMGESDIVKVSEMLPGIVSVGEGAAGLNVRGGGFDQNAFYFNKVAVYNTSHMFGFYPAFNAYIISDFSIYKGYVPSKYGGRLSSIFDIKARSGNKKHYTAKGGISLIAANLTVEGPIKKDTASFLVNYRTSYSDWILRLINNYDIQNSEASFNDLTVSLDYDLPNTQINVFGYFSNDYFKFSNLNQYWYSNSGISTSVGHHFSPDFRGDFSLSGSQYKFKTIDTQIINLEYEHPFKLSQVEFNADFRKEFNRRNSLSFGASGIVYQLNRGRVIPYTDDSNIKEVDLGDEQGLEVSAYASDNFQITPLLNMNAGLRLSMYSAFGPKKVYTYYDGGPKEIRTIEDSIYFDSGEAMKWYTFPEFRISFNYQTDENGNIKLAFTQMHQSIFMLNQTISLSPNTQWKLADYHLKPSRSNQISLGVFRTIPKGKWELSAEVFYKNATDYSAFKDGVSFLSTPHVETTVLQGDLTSYGLELLVKKSWQKLDLWLAYTFSRSFVLIDGENDWEKINNGIKYPSDFDIPNVLNAIVMYKLSKRVSFSTTITYQTGKPATFPTSFYYIDGIPRIDYSNRNEFRIPDYFRTDISVTIEGNLKKEKFMHSTLNLSVYNLTGRKNPYSVYFEETYGRLQGFQYSVIGVPIFMATWIFKLGNYDAE